MSLTVTPESGELRFKQKLEDFFSCYYDEKILPSHGIEHHRRVWNYAKELLHVLNSQQKIQDSFDTEKLLIACYLHDIGMSVSSGVSHGHHSKDLCISFFHKYNLNETDYGDVLAAIENHDNKEYTSSDIAFDLLTILSVSDDLDAFGYIGIYRYTEIYLKRGTNPEELGILINNNAHKRFDNFSRLLGFSDELINKYQKKYMVLESFFKEYNRQVPGYIFGGDHPSGYCGVIEKIGELSKNNIALNEFLRKPEYQQDRVSEWFFKQLSSEISS